MDCLEKKLKRNKKKLIRIYVIQPNQHMLVFEHQQYDKCMYTPYVARFYIDPIIY